MLRASPPLFQAAFVPLWANSFAPIKKAAHSTLATLRSIPIFLETRLGSTGLMGSLPDGSRAKSGPEPFMKRALSVRHSSLFMFNERKGPADAHLARVTDLTIPDRERPPPLFRQTRDKSGGLATSQSIQHASWTELLPA